MSQIAEEKTKLFPSRTSHRFGMTSEAEDKSTLAGISTLINVRRETQGQLVVMPNRRSKQQDVEQLSSIMTAYVSALYKETTSVILVMMPTSLQAFELNTQFQNDRIKCRSLNFQISRRTIWNARHLIIFADIETYRTMNHTSFETFKNCGIKTTLFLYREEFPHVDDNDDENSPLDGGTALDHVFDFEAPEDDDTPMVYLPKASPKTSRERIFIFRETQARGVVVAWIDNFPHGNGQVNEFDDDAISDPTETLSTIVDRLQNVILV